MTKRILKRGLAAGAAALCLLTGCQGGNGTGDPGNAAAGNTTKTESSGKPEGGEKVQLYYPDVAGTGLRAVDGIAAGDTLNERVQSILVQLQEKPTTEQSELTQDAFGLGGNMIQGATIKDGLVTVDMAKKYSDLKYSTELLFRSALVWSLTSLEGIDYVAVTVDGTMLLDSAGMIVREMSRDTLLIDGELSPEPTITVRFTIYFADGTRKGLVSEERRAEIVAGTEERAVVEALIAGPETEGLWATVPSGTKVRSVTVSDRVCYVDLSDDFLSRQGLTGISEELTVYSIVNSLCELDTVERVQFLIEGEKRTGATGALDFSQTFTADPTRND